MTEKKLNSIPTLYEWAGGMETFEMLTEVFYKKVLLDPMLEPIFKHMSSQHQLHVAHFIAEVFGGPKMYSTEEGSHFKMKFINYAKAISHYPHHPHWISIFQLRK